jgi:hypothetical protein
MKLTYPTECGNEVLIPLKISGISIIYPTGLDKKFKLSRNLLHSKLATNIVAIC